VGPARIIAESLTPKPGIREHNRGKADISDAPCNLMLLKTADEPVEPFLAFQVIGKFDHTR